MTDQNVIDKTQFARSILLHTQQITKTAVIFQL